MRGYNAAILAAGLGVGIFGGMFGLGGGIIMVPLLLYLFKKDIHTATATSLAVIGPLAVSGTVGNILSGKIIWTAFFAMSAGSVIGAYAGAGLSKKVPKAALRKALGYAVMLTAVSMVIFPAKAVDEKLVLVDTGLISLLLMFLSGLAVGVFAGMLGLGGGIILNPIMLFGFGFTAQQTVATSLAIIVPTSLSGSIKQYRSGHIDLKLFLLLAGGACAGSFAGAKIKDHINNEDLKILLGVVVFLIALFIILKKSGKE